MKQIWSDHFKKDKTAPTVGELVSFLAKLNQDGELQLWTVDDLFGGLRLSFPNRFEVVEEDDKTTVRLIN